MIDCLTPADWHGRNHLLQDMHQLRCRVFKGRLDWEVSDENGFEWDTFDTLDPIYLLAHDDNDRLVGTWRMLPTTGPYMLRDVFPVLLDGTPAPASPTIWEGSRFAVDCDYVGRSGLGAVSKVTSEIFCAVIELCLAHGVEEVVTVYDARIARLLPRIGCAPKWRSKVHRIGKTLTMAGRFDVNETVLERVRERGGIEGPVIRSLPRPHEYFDVPHVAPAFEIPRVPETSKVAQTPKPLPVSANNDAPLRHAA